MSISTNLGTLTSVPGRVILGGGPRTIYLSARSDLSLRQRISDEWDYLNAFDLVIPMLGLHDDSQGADALVHAFFKYAGQTSKRTGTLSSPFEEVLIRLEQAGVNPHALTYLRQYMNAAKDAYARRN